MYSIMECKCDIYVNCDINQFAVYLEIKPLNLEWDLQCTKVSYTII